MNNGTEPDDEMTAEIDAALVEDDQDVVFVEQAALTAAERSVW